MGEGRGRQRLDGRTGPTLAGGTTTNPAILGRVGPEQQFFDVAYHAEFGLDDHINTIYLENDMDTLTTHVFPGDWADPGPVFGAG